MSTARGDLQARIAAYLSRIKGCPATVAEIAAAIGAPQPTTLVLLAAITAGEARPYPIVQHGGKYRWVHDPADSPATLSGAAEMVGYVTGADRGRAVELAGVTLRVAAAAPRIVWANVQYGGWTGLAAGKVRLFDISWRIAKEGKDWQMTTVLPGFTRKTWEDNDPAELKARAGQVLASWALACL